MKQSIVMCLKAALLLVVGSAHAATCNSLTNSAFYGYKSGSECYKTLEEAEADLRTGEGPAGLPLMELAFPIPVDFFANPGSESRLDYRPLGALSNGSEVLTMGAASVQSAHRLHVIGWPPAAIAPGCATSACPAGVCNVFEDQVALVQCTFDATWHSRPNYSWTRTGPAQSTNQISGPPQSITGVGEPNGVLNFLPTSSTATGWGSTISITAQSAAGTGEITNGEDPSGPTEPEAISEFK